MFGCDNRSISALTKFFDKLVFRIYDKGGVECGEVMVQHLEIEICEVDEGIGPSTCKLLMTDRS